MSDSKDVKIERLQELLESAEANLKIARQILADVGILPESKGGPKIDYSKLASGMSRREEGESQIIEGVFDGQNMVGSNGKAYPVAANYASKSKLIPGDQLKLTIMPNGSFLYKQIGPVERKREKGLLSYEDGQYKVVIEGKSYNVLLASVTYFKASIGDEITLIIPANGEGDWGAIENVIPHS